jgi:hypothetical protein
VGKFDPTYFQLQEAGQRVAEGKGVMKSARPLLLNTSGSGPNGASTHSLDSERICSPCPPCYGTLGTWLYAHRFPRLVYPWLIVGCHGFEAIDNQDGFGHRNSSLIQLQFTPRKKKDIVSERHLSASLYVFNICEYQSTYRRYTVVLELILSMLWYLPAEITRRAEANIVRPPSHRWLESRAGLRKYTTIDVMLVEQRR